MDPDRDAGDARDGERSSDEAVIPTPAVDLGVATDPEEEPGRPAPGTSTPGEPAIVPDEDGMLPAPEVPAAPAEEREPGSLPPTPRGLTDEEWAATFYGRSKSRSPLAGLEVGKGWLLAAVLVAVLVVLVVLVIALHGSF